MAKKKTTKKKTAKKIATKKTASKKVSAKKPTKNKKVTKKAISKKKPAKKAASKKATGKKAAGKKSATKQSASSKKKTSTKSKVSSKKAGKKSAKKKIAKKAAAKRNASKKSSTKKKSASNKKTVSKKRSKKPASKPVEQEAIADSSQEQYSNAHEQDQLTDEQMRKVKTGLTKRDLKYFQQLLLEKRAEISGDVTSLDTTRTDSIENGESHVPLHMADAGSDNYEQDFMLGLVESEKTLLIEIDEALSRISNGTYGVCVISGAVIAKARLEIQPWAKYCIEVARQRED